LAPDFSNVQLIDWASLAHPFEILDFFIASLPELIFPGENGGASSTLGLDRHENTLVIRDLA
jgi:hypothetical protein